jgi:hypothetical protein
VAIAKEEEEKQVPWKSAQVCLHSEGQLFQQ